MSENFCVIIVGIIHNFHMDKFTQTVVICLHDQSYSKKKNIGPQKASLVP